MQSSQAPSPFAPPPAKTANPTSKVADPNSTPKKPKKPTTPKAGNLTAKPLQKPIKTCFSAPFDDPLDAELDKAAAIDELKAKISATQINIYKLSKRMIRYTTSFKNHLNPYVLNAINPSKEEKLARNNLQKKLQDLQNTLEELKGNLKTLENS